MGKILAICELHRQNLRKASLETIFKAAQIGHESCLGSSALVYGYDIKHLIDEIEKYGIEHILLADDQKLSNAYLNSYLQIIEAAIKKTEAEYVFFPATTKGKALAAMTAAKFSTSAINDCISIKIENGQLLAQRAIYAGKVIVTVSVQKKPVIVSLRPGVFQAIEMPKKAVVEELNVTDRKSVV